MSPWTQPTHSEPAPAGKLRWLWLVIPWLVAVLLAVGWSVYWLWLMGEVQHRLDAGAASLRAEGWRVSWRHRHTGGYPFRIDADYAGLAIAEPSGWGVATPMLKTEAYAFAPGHWVFFAPSGLSFTRPGAGTVNVVARVFRGSVTELTSRPPDIALEGDDLAFAPAPGAQPFWLASARNVQVYTRPGPDDQGAAYLSIEGATAAPGGWLAGLAAAPAPVSLTTDVVLDHMSAFAGPSWRAAVTSWSRAGGQAQLGHLDLEAGQDSFSAQSGTLGVASDGRLTGRIALIATLAGARTPTTLTFAGGAARLGPVRIGAAPAVF